MKIQLDHLPVPARGRFAAAQLIAGVLGVPCSAQVAIGPCTPVHVNDGLTLDFDQWPDPIPRLHHCFRVEQADIDAILARIRAAGIDCRSTPQGPDDQRVNPAIGGSIVYWGEPDDHVWELLTISHERQIARPATQDRA